MSPRPRSFAGFALPAVLVAATSLHASTILSENFNELTPALAVTSVGAFTAINGTNVDIVGGSLYGGLCAGPESGNCVDLGGSGGKADGQLTLATTLNLAAGTYNLSFDLIGSQRGGQTSTTVTFGTFTQTFLLNSSDVTDGIFSQAITLSGGPTQLEFLNNGVGDPSAGALLDNVSITSGSTPPPAVTPEPASLTLLATGLLGTVGAVRRRLTA